MHARASHDRAALAAVGAMVVALAAILFVVTAAPAFAHATVVSSTPADGARFPADQAPTEVTIQFSETISSELGGLKVLNRDGTRVDTGSSDQPSPASLHTTLQPDLPEGAYIANYQVISADGHPVSGAITFLVGNAVAGDLSNLAAKNSTTYDALSKLGQFIVYAGALLAAGLAFFLAFVHDGGSGGATMARVVRWSTVVAALGIAVVLVAQAAQATGKGPVAIFDRATVAPVLRQGLGWSEAVLLVGLALCHLSVDSTKRLVTQTLAFYGGLTVSASFVLWGHAVELDKAWLAIPADVLHVAVAALWFGGLVGVVVLLRARTKDAEPAATRPADAPTDGDGDGAVVSSSGGVVALASTVDVVRRFSAMAGIALGLLVVAGLALSVSTVGSLDALWSTAYGVTLLVKVGAVAVVGFVAAYNRFFLLPWLFDISGDEDDAAVGADPDGAPDDVADAEVRAGWRTLLRTMAVEAAGIVVVLGITAVLVNTPPAATAPKTTGPFSQEQTFESGKLSLVITPNVVGSNSFHLELIGADGKPADLAKKVTLELRLPAQGVGPLTREMLKAGTGHFLLENVTDMSIAGTWNVALIARVDDFTEKRVEFEDTIT